MPVVSARRRLLIEASPETGLESPVSRAESAVDPLESMSGQAGPEAEAPLGWFSAPVASQGISDHPWDEAHRALDDPTFTGLESAPVYVEPDFFQRFPYAGPDDVSLESLSGSNVCRHSGPDPFWPPATLQFGWHLDDAHSQLHSARVQAGDPGDGRRVRIAILDTGYDPEHTTIPPHFRADLQRNFFDSNLLDATDSGRHLPQNQPGHGTATMALLAGNHVQVPLHGFDDFLGGAPFAEIVPIRIADSVIHLGTEAMARGIEYAIQAGCRVISISMGSVPARSWARVVNRAYEAGIAIFAAAGNRIGPSPPSSIVYPARFRRVVAVCGVTADQSPYFCPGLHRKMQGCFGPESKMSTALAAYTPSTPWALMGCGALIVDDGGAPPPRHRRPPPCGSSRRLSPRPSPPGSTSRPCATPSSSSALKNVPERSRFFGQGLLRAMAALGVTFPDGLTQTPRDEVSFAWLRLAGFLESVPAETGREQMFEVEALQVYVQSPDLQAITGGADPQTEDLDPATRRQLIGAMRHSPLASRALRAHLEELYGQL